MAVDLGKEIGPLPLGAWIAVVGAGLGIAYYTRNNGGGVSAGNAGTTDAGVVDNTGTPAGVGDGTVGGWTPTTPSGGDPGTITPEAPSTNEEWGNRAVNWLIAQGYDPAWAYSAITKALAGGRGEDKLSVREYTLWREALRALGAPPTPIDIPAPSPIPSPTPTPTPTPTPHPTNPPTPPTKPTIVISRHEFVPGGANGKCKRCGHAKDNYFYHFRHQTNPAQPGANAYTYARVTPPPLPGSTLRSMAQIYYKDGSKWHEIYNANRSGTRRADGTPGMIVDPNKLHPGWKLIIPKR